MAFNPLWVLGIVGGGVGLLMLTSRNASASPLPGGMPPSLPPGGGGLPTDVNPPGAPPPPTASTPTYVVKQDDYPTKIAKAFTGDASRWRELIQANPQKPVAKTGKFAGSFATLTAGERLYLPPGWV
jgi:hypothetical protein